MGFGIGMRGVPLLMVVMLQLMMRLMGMMMTMLGRGAVLSRDVLSLSQ